MIKKIAALLFCCACLVCGRIEAAVAGVQEENEKDTELIVLIDTSRSITGEKKEKEIQWAKEICVFCQVMDMSVTYVYFDNYKEDYGIACSTADGTEACLEILTDISHKGTDTELAGPMRYAVSLMNEKRTKNKYIIMLSDGDEDLVQRNGRSLEEVPLSKDEEERIKEFKELVKGFNEKENQEVVLVGLKEDICLFSAMKKEQRIPYFTGTEGTEKSLIHIFELGYPTEETEEKEGSGSIPVELREDLEGAVLHIRWDGNLENAEDLLHVIYHGKEQDISNKFSIGSSSMLAYIDKPEGGEYRIELPAKNLRATTFQLERIVIDSIELSILKDNKPVGSEKKEGGNTELTGYAVESGDIEFLLQPRMKKGDVKKWNPTVMFSIDPYEEGKEEYLQEDKEGWKETDWISEAEAIRFQVSNIEPGNYLCTVKTVTNRQTDISNMIFIQVEQPAPDSDPKVPVVEDTKSKKTGEEISLEDFITDDKTKKYCFTISRGGDYEDVKFRFDGTYTSEALEVKDEKLIFREEGTYKMTVDKEGKTQNITNFVITRDKIWYEKLLDMICFWKK